MPRTRAQGVVAAALVSLTLVAAPPGAPASTAKAGASALPRLFSGLGETFKVRPHTVGLICADGGELVVKWNRWTAKSASGTGTSRPCRGDSLRIQVTASRPVDGYFTRLAVKYKGYSTGHLGLCHQAGSMTWMNLEWMNDPDSGATPWPS